MNQTNADEYRQIYRINDEDTGTLLNIIRLDCARSILRDLPIREMPRHPHIVSLEQWLDLNA